MIFELFGYEIIIRKANKAERLIKITESHRIPLTKIGLIKALRIEKPETGLVEAKEEVERLFDFVVGVPIVKK